MIGNWIKSISMNNSEKSHSEICDVCGGKPLITEHKMTCPFCGFKKLLNQIVSIDSDDLIFAIDVNKFFKNKYKTLKRGDTFGLCVPVSRFYMSPKPIPGQINFFTSKNIMFLIEQHGFQFVSRKSRFSTTLSLIIRKV